jgi:hypothetical protein
MSARAKTAGYVELSSRGFALLTGAYTSANRRARLLEVSVAKNLAPGQRRVQQLSA